MKNLFNKDSRHFIKDNDNSSEMSFSEKLLTVGLVIGLSVGIYVLIDGEWKEPYEQPTDVELVSEDLRPIEKLEETLSEVEHRHPVLEKPSSTLLHNAKLEDPYAQYQLAHWYRRNHPREPHAAFKYMFKAARNGYPSAIDELGDWYAEGYGIQKDSIRGYAWHYIARYHGIPVANWKFKHYEKSLTELDLKKAMGVVAIHRDYVGHKMREWKSKKGADVKVRRNGKLVTLGQ